MRDIGIGFRIYEDYMNFVFLYLHPCKYSYMKYLLLLMVLFYSVSSHSAEGDVYYCNVEKAYSIQVFDDRIVHGLLDNFTFKFKWGSDAIVIAGNDNFFALKFDLVNNTSNHFTAFNTGRAYHGFITYYDGNLYMSQSGMGGMGWSYGARCSKF